MLRHAAQQLRTIIIPLAVGAGLGLGIAIGASAVALSPAAANTAVASATAVTRCSSNSPCVGGANSKAGDGVQGTSNNGYGVVGKSNGNVGLNGFGGPASYGVLGSGGYGGAFTSTQGFALEAFDHTPSGSVALFAQSKTGQDGVFNSLPGDTQTPVVIYGGTNAGSGSKLLELFSSDNVGHVAFDDSGNAVISGEIYTDGQCVNGCAKDRERSYAPRESEPTMEDVGEGQLVDGIASVALDLAFANVIDTKSKYSIFLTPEGDSNGLYVAGRTRRGFIVRENRGGHSTVAFNYRIVAKPFGTSEPRLPIVALPLAVTRPKSATTLGHGLAP